MNITKQIFDQIEQISVTKNYWFVRTNAGEYFEDYLKGGYIAIGHDYIKLFEISEALKTEDPSKTISYLIEKRERDNKMPNHTASQLLKFVYEIKNGDIVLIPSESSNEIAFGEVIETPVYLKDESSDIDGCPYQKRKRVQWIKTVPRFSLNPNLFRLMYSHHTITNAYEYDKYIDKTVSSFFFKNGNIHLVLDVSTQEGIQALDLFKFGLTLFDIAEDFSKSENLETISKDVEVKLNLESPGAVEFITTSVYTLTILAFIIVLLNGGEAEISIKVASFKIKTDGFLEKLGKYLNEKVDRDKKKLIIKQLERMEVKSPEDVKKLIGIDDGLNKDSNNDTLKS